MSDKHPAPANANPADSAAPELFAAFREAVAARREAELRCARLLAQLGDERLRETFGGVNVDESGERHGLATSSRGRSSTSGAHAASIPTSRTRPSPAPSPPRPPPAAPKS